MLTARAIMNDDVVSIQPESTVQEAIEMLLKEHISGLPVTDDDGQLIGIVTEFALLAIAYDERVRHDAVRQHMTTEVFTVDPDAPVNKIADVCIMHRVQAGASGGRWPHHWTDCSARRFASHVRSKGSDLYFLIISMHL